MKISFSLQALVVTFAISGCATQSQELREPAEDSAKPSYSGDKEYRLIESILFRPSVSYHKVWYEDAVKTCREIAAVAEKGAIHAIVFGQKRVLVDPDRPHENANVNPKFFSELTFSQSNAKRYRSLTEVEKDIAVGTLRAIPEDRDFITCWIYGKNPVETKEVTK
jgi:hypothetical protein